MRKALIVTDYQYDFAADDGKLTVGKPAQEIEAEISKLAESYAEDDIFFMFDCHSETDWETDIFPEPKVFPKHCIEGTKGYELYGNIKGSTNKKNYVKKHAYCPGFEFLDRIAEDYDQVTVTGLVTDICVFQTVVGLYTAAVNKGIRLELIVPPSACASFNLEREAQSLKYMQEVLSVKLT